MAKIRVTFWNEFRHERSEEACKKLYPNGLHAFVADFLNDDEVEVTLAALDDPENGLPDSLLNNTDVLMWWGHVAHGEVPDALVNKIKRRVFDCGMGFIALHSAHFSKPFGAIVGTSGYLSWGDEQKEVLWNLKPTHPIMKGVPEHIVIEREEMYGEPFMIPEPDELVIGGWFEHGNIFRSGCCFYRGLGRVFYFQPGHETAKSYYNPDVQQIIKNAVRWAAPTFQPNKFPASCDYTPNLF